LRAAFSALRLSFLSLSAFPPPAPARVVAK
jgi:hypothetical protein